MSTFDPNSLFDADTDRAQTSLDEARALVDGLTYERLQEDGALQDCRRAIDCLRSVGAIDAPHQSADWWNMLLGATLKLMDLPAGHAPGCVAMSLRACVAQCKLTP